MLRLYIGCWKKIFTWSGRANRREFVVFMAVSIAIGMALIWPVNQGRYGFFLGYLLWAFLCVLPSLALTVRRVHDIGLNGWWLLAWFATAAVLSWGVTRLLYQSESGIRLSFALHGILYNAHFFVLALWPGQRSDNRFGAKP